MQLRIGTRIGKYELLQRLGAGAMGEVYRARDHVLARDVAIKFLPERLASDTERAAGLVKEARAASSLNHPNIITIHDVGHSDGIHYLVMEYIAGQTLRQLLNGRPLSSKQILDIAVQIADGLAKAHAAGIVHRDLKPENIMITADGLVKILDFGLAKMYLPDSANSGGSVSSMSEDDTLSFPAVSSEGFIVGTVGYISPEQASGSRADHRSDQFALGAILYEMVSGRRAFKRKTPIQTLSATIDTEPESLASLNELFPAPARWALERCLSKNPKDRYTSTTDLAMELHSVREHLSEASLPLKMLNKPGAHRLRRSSLVLILITAVLIGIFAVPPLRDYILEKTQLLSIPSDKRIAVLPFSYSGSNEKDRLLCDGLLSYLTHRLKQLERFQEMIWIIPTLEVREAGVMDPEKALRALGATITVQGNLERVGDRLFLSTRLVSTDSLRQLRTETIEIDPEKVSLLQEAVKTVIGMLDLELLPEAQNAVRTAQTSNVEASSAYAQALGYTPYKRARTNLERYEQQQNLEEAISLFLRCFLRRCAGIRAMHWLMPDWASRTGASPVLREMKNTSSLPKNTAAGHWIWTTRWLKPG